MSDLLAGAPVSFQVRVVRSVRRRRTACGRMVKGTLVVRVPASAPAQEVERLVRVLEERFRRQRMEEGEGAQEGLRRRADQLNNAYFAGKLRFSRIEYTSGQTSKFGCCHVRERAIRISSRVRLMPAWVRDYVIVHELAHLLEPNHGKAFWQLVRRYRRAERAQGFLMGVGMKESLFAGNDIING